MKNLPSNLMIEKPKDFFKIFKIPMSFQIDKNELKKRYFDLSKKIHPDVSADEQDFTFLNKAYSTLSDDYLRAKLFTSPKDKITNDFLMECLDYEERIAQGENLKPILNNLIDECKNHYKDPIWLTKWGYYRRLMDLNDGNQ